MSDSDDSDEYDEDDESSGVFERISNVVTTTHPRPTRIAMVRILFEPSGILLGLRWDRRDDGLYIYVHVVPTLPLLIIIGD